MNKIVYLLKGLAIKKQHYSNKRNPCIWVFGEWFGEKCYDNSLFMANYIAMNHPEIHVYWTSKKNIDLSLLDTRISCLVFGTEKAFSIYKIAGVVFMNQGLRDFSELGFDYFDGAIKINLWHGVMWKRIGHDGSKKDNLLYNLYKKINDYTFGSSYYLAVSEEYAKVCKSAFGADRRHIIRDGYPRNSVFYNKENLKNAKRQVIDILSNETGYHWSYNTRIITYMPTFRDNVKEVFSCEELEKDEVFLNWLEDNNIVLLQKMHFITQKRETESIKLHKQKRIITFNKVSPQILLAATDLLITDYSSCFFDFLLLDRPIIHFLYDYNYYKDKDRGLYYESKNVVCGDIATDKTQLKDLLVENILNPEIRHELRMSRRKKYMTYETSKSCENIYKKVLKILNAKK